MRMEEQSEIESGTGRININGEKLHTIAATSLQISTLYRSTSGGNGK